MNILIILFSLLTGYVFFMMSFYLLAKVLFPKMDHEQTEDAVKEQMEILKIQANLEARRAAKTSKTSYGFNKQPQVA